VKECYSFRVVMHTLVVMHYSVHVVMCLYSTYVRTYIHTACSRARWDDRQHDDNIPRSFNQLSL